MASRKYCVLLVFCVMVISSVLFFSDVLFSFTQQLNYRLKLIVQFCPQQREVIWWLASDAVSKCQLSTHIRTFHMSETFTFALYEFYTNCQSRCLVIHIVAVLLLYYCKQYLMEFLNRILPNIWMCHGSLIILMKTD